MSYSTFPIVGAYYRPPAQLLIDTLAIDTPLYILAEPDNPADPNAIAVYLESKNISEASYEVLEQNLPNFGLSLEEVLNQQVWQLGYLPKNFAAQLKASETVIDNLPIDVRFTLNSDAKPRVKFDEPIL